MNKYHNKKTTIVYNGELYKLDSKKEAARFVELTKLLISGKIKNLSIHPLFVLQKEFIDREGRKVRAIYYEADFKFYDKETKKLIIEDTKGFFTEAYKIKRKMFMKILPKNAVFIES